MGFFVVIGVEDDYVLGSIKYDNEDIFEVILSI